MRVVLTIISVRTEEQSARGEKKEMLQEEEVITKGGQSCILLVWPVPFYQWYFICNGCPRLLFYLR